MTDGPRHILVAGIGNIFLGDDAFGVEVVRRLLEHPHGDGVRIVDFGIRGVDLTYALLDPYDLVILVDAVARGASRARSICSNQTSSPRRRPVRPAA